MLEAQPELARALAPLDDLRCAAQPHLGELLPRPVHPQVEELRIFEVGEKQQNGDVEAANGAIKRRLDQALLARGSRDFESGAAWQAFVDETLRKANANRGHRVAEDLAAMRELGVAKLPEYVEEDVQVSEWSTVRVKHCAYSVPSRLMGEWVRVRIFEDRLEVVYANEVQLACERLRGRNLRRIDYRHVIWLVEVDRALREVRAMANLRTALILSGAGGLVGVARRLHRVTLGDRPFVPFGWTWRGEQALDRASNGTLYLDARGLRRGFRAALANLRALDLRVRLVACVDSTKPVIELAAVISRLAMLSIPPLTERKDEIERLLEAYASDAVVALGASWLGLRPDDSELLLDSEIETHDELEEFARRLVTIRNWGISEGAKRLGITHGALSRWALRWRIPR